MRRPLFASLFVLAFAGAALSEPSLDELKKDSAKKKEIDKAEKLLDSYFKLEAEQAKGGKASVANALAEAQEKFLAWLGTTQGSLGVDLRSQPDVIIQMIDRARIKYLEGKYKKSSIEYVTVENAKGVKRGDFGYAYLVPPAYDPAKAKIPIVLSLHGRVINTKHPAFRNGAFEERARETVWNNWFKNPASEQVLVIAPTTDNNGFQFLENHQDDLTVLFRALGVALSEYRGDWDRVFLDVQGKAFRVALEQCFLFAGIIVRDRPDDRSAPFLAPEHFFLLENLNGVPVCYVADAAHWDKVGKPFADALTAAYAKAGKPENLVIIQAQRDVDLALRGGEDKIKEFLAKHERVKVREKFTWRFFDTTQATPLPLSVEANLLLDVDEAARKAPLAAKAGRISFEVKRDSVEGQDVNRVELKVTEAEGLGIFLTEPLLNLDLPVMIVVNGETVMKPKKFERDWQFFFDQILGRRFLMMPFVGQTSVAFPLKPEFASPEKPKPAGDTPPAKPPDGTPAGGTPPGPDGEKKMSGK